MEQVKKKKRKLIKPTQPIASAKPCGFVNVILNLIPKQNEGKQSIFADRVHSV